MVGALGPLDQWRGTVVAREDCILLTLTGERIQSLAMKFGADFKPIFNVLCKRIDQTIAYIEQAQLPKGLSPDLSPELVPISIPFFGNEQD